MENSRAYNRAQRERFIKKVNSWSHNSKENNLRLINNRAKCSCHMCGNPRKHFKQKTLQEIKVLACTE